MPRTWGDLKTQVYYKLDLVSTTTGDVESAVEDALEETLRNIGNSMSLPGLLQETSAVNLVGPATTLSLSSDFSLTSSDFSELYVAQINTDPTSSTSEYEHWEELSFEAYIKSKTVFRHRTPDYKVVLYPNRDTLLFTTTPESGDTWGVRLFYYRPIGGFVTANEPELPEEHRSVLVNGAAIQFPQYFSGDRAPLFEKFTAQYQKDIERLQVELRPRSSLKRLKSRVGSSNRGIVNWS